ncbi:unnamed protein product [Clonostachys rhizophaga]|uniref:Uncharacterized protein n=1 Tax=Clonostachys rhizophaga TaxID=160324 RepID=A0A9N9VM13_9HYPO|nr:unnamed protein product [Clonostachys rhizophaga]
MEPRSDFDLDRELGSLRRPGLKAGHWLLHNIERKLMEPRPKFHPPKPKLMKKKKQLEKREGHSGQEQESVRSLNRGAEGGVLGVPNSKVVPQPNSGLRRPAASDADIYIAVVHSRGCHQQA